MDESVKLIIWGKVSLLNLGLAGPLHKLDNRLGSHASRLGGKVDTLPRAFGNISRGIRGHTSLNTTRTVVLGDGMILDLGDLTSRNLIGYPARSRMAF